MANKNKKPTKKKDTAAVPFSRLDVYRELQTINQRVSTVSVRNCKYTGMINFAKLRPVL